MNCQSWLCQIIPIIQLNPWWQWIQKRWQSGVHGISVRSSQPASTRAGNGCSIWSDNGDLIRGEKWNELCLGIRIPALIPAKIIQVRRSAFHYFRSLHYGKAHRTQQQQTKRVFSGSHRGRVWGPVW